MNISECAAIVTGGASGLGEGTARMLASAGAQVSIFDIDRVRGEQVAKEISGTFAQVDVSNEESVLTGLDAAAEAHGESRILVNCAGIIIGQKTTNKGEPHSITDFEKVISINLTGTFNCIRLIATRMVDLDLINEEERGVIVNTSSVAAYDGQIGQAAYAASKGGIVGMTLAIARDLSQHAIRVVTVAPGIFKSALLADIPEKVQDSLKANLPFPKRFGEPAEYAALVRHICENAMLNGETIRLDGAVRMPPR